MLSALGGATLGGCTTPPASTPQPTAAVHTVSVPVTAVALARNGTLGTSTYRIPAIAVTKDGTIVVSYDARRRSAADLPNEIDIVERRSTDDGATWTTQTVAVAHSGSTPATADGVGDSSLVYDRTTNRIFLFYDLSPARVGIFTSSTGRRPTDVSTVQPMLRHSDDDGRTWSAPVDLISELKQPGMAGIFASSGHGTQTADGTLLQPYSYFVHDVQHAALAYSRDHGLTWRLTPPIGAHLSENKVVQLPDGTLLDDARPVVPGDRMFSRAACVGCGWSPTTPVRAMPDPSVNGDLIGTGRPGWLLESNPDSPLLRLRLTLRLSTDDGRTWPYHWVVTAGPSGYSVLAALPDGEFALVYEGVGGLWFERFPLTQLRPERFPLAG